ncbi:DNA-binding response regulator [Bermanella sp. 47_1433_sub80_T6]|nr:DNA-binding response regulator [Bermanella sp. 47_1433_sub80_T6]
MKKRILVIEDDQDINNLIAMNLKDMNHDVDTCDNGKRGYQMAVAGNYDVLVLDLMLPEMDGLEICRALRAANIFTPILMLTARDSEADRIVGLEMGADDYLTKPFSVRELQARVKAMLRRVAMMTAPQVESDQLVFDGLSIDVAKRQVLLNSEEIELTSTEFDLLLYMARQPSLVFSRTQLLDNVWGYQHSGYEHTVNSHINRLRNKLEKDPAKPQYILTVWGVGYKFEGHANSDKTPNGKS